MVVVTELFLLLFVFVFITPEGFNTMVANEDLEKVRAQVPREATALHPLQWGWCKLGAELSRLPGEKNPSCYSGAGTWDLRVCSPVF